MSYFAEIRRHGNTGTDITIDDFFMFLGQMLKLFTAIQLLAFHGT